MTDDLSPPVVEIADTKSADWAWRCHCCDITNSGRDELTAHEEANGHKLTRTHMEALRSWTRP